MSLSARVYKSLAALPMDLKDAVRLVDPETGELEFLQPDSAVQYPPDYLVALKVWVGNVSKIYQLENETRVKCGDRCDLLLNAFLYSGIHSGDTIKLSQMEPLKRELDLLQSENSLSGGLKSFIASIRQLIAAAETEGNPIVFV
jgi:hypothetical protein